MSEQRLIEWWAQRAEVYDNRARQAGPGSVYRKMNRLCQRAERDLAAAIERLDKAERRVEALEDDELIEILADIEHERWSGWMRYQFENWNDENIKRWKLLMKTAYACLPEYSKESDRKEVRKTLGAVKDYLDALKEADGAKKI